jgi:hypothetical protein
MTRSPVTLCDSYSLALNRNQTPSTQTDRQHVPTTAVEWAVAHRLRKAAPNEIKHILADVADEAWVERAYGLDFFSDADDPASDDVAQVNERGVHAHYEIKEENPSKRPVEDLARKLMERRERARRTGSIPILDTYFEAPSLWFGPTPSHVLEPPDALARLHQHLLSLTFSEGTCDWKTRLLVMQALRRALLRESVLLRLLPEKTDRDERGVGGSYLLIGFSPLCQNSTKVWRIK